MCGHCQKIKIVSLIAQLADRNNVYSAVRWYVQDEMNQDSKQNAVDVMKKAADSTGEVMHCERAVGDL